MKVKERLKKLQAGKVRNTRSYLSIAVLGIGLLFGGYENAVAKGKVDGGVGPKPICAGAPRDYGSGNTVNVGGTHDNTTIVTIGCGTVSRPVDNSPPGGQDGGPKLEK